MRRWTLLREFPIVCRTETVEQFTLMYSRQSGEVSQKTGDAA